MESLNNSNAKNFLIVWLDMMPDPQPDMDHNDYTRQFINNELSDSLVPILGDIGFAKLLCNLATLKFIRMKNSKLDNDVKLIEALNEYIGKRKNNSPNE